MILYTCRNILTTYRLFTTSARPFMAVSDL